MKRLHWPEAMTGTLRVTGDGFHHLVTVLRVKAGDALELFDGRGTAFPAVVEAVGRDDVTLSLGEGRVAPPPRLLAVVQGLPRAEKLELVLQKGTEVGAGLFLPAAAQRSVVKLDGKEEKKLERWQRIVAEAARQCGRADVPTVLAPCPLSQAVDRLPPDTKVFVLDEEERARPLAVAAAPHLGTHAPFAVVVGPEGGLTREEVDALVARGAVPVTLGRLVLRTETAALAALVVLRHLDGELG